MVATIKTALSSLSSPALHTLRLRIYMDTPIGIDGIEPDDASYFDDEHGHVDYLSLYDIMTGRCFASLRLAHGTIT